MARLLSKAAAARDVERSALKLQRPTSLALIRVLVRALQKWFLKAARDLPWRRTLDPYAIWVSEIMLQQTQVKTVIPYWERWMRELPDVAVLAACPEPRLLKLWEGLGYYRRVRNLQLSARTIASNLNGAFPFDFDTLLALPGVGRYTAGAVASIAFDQPVPILDGNVIRVLTRIFGIRANPKARDTNEFLWDLSRRFVEAARANMRGHPAEVNRTAEASDGELKFAGPCSVLNQSLMELGATVCLPRQAKCVMCPIKRQCIAHRQGLVDEIPNLAVREKATARRFVAFVIEKGGRYLVRQRQQAVVNGGLWEWPNVETSIKGTISAPALAASLGLELVEQRPLAIIRHSITRYRIDLKVFRAQLDSPSPSIGKDFCWLKMAELEEVAFSSAHRQVVQLIAEAPLAKVRPQT